MGAITEVKVPDIGDFKDVPIIEVLVKPGDTVKPEDPLISLESDKATMEVPSPAGGVVKAVSVNIGDKVSEGSLILMLEAEGAAQAAAPPPKVSPPPAPTTAPGGVAEVKVPDIGDFKDIPIIEVLVKPGDTVRAEQPLITLESDKATMEVPSPIGGIVQEVKAKLGDKVSEGSVILTLSTGVAAPSPAAAAPAPAAPAAAAPPAAPAAAYAPAASSAEGKAAEAAPAGTMAAGSKGAEGVPPVAMLKPGSAAAKAKPQPKAAEQLVMKLMKESPRDARAAPPLKLDRSIDPPRVAPDVSKGYEALRGGDLASARKFYEAAVAADSVSLDGHLGLATVAARSGDRPTATRHYRRALELDPRNSSAVAGLASLADFSRPDTLEAQLRADLTRYPQSAALQYTLGNLYAAQSRWNEAQAAYFEAYRLDPENADIAYNLAVSLDHLGQSRLAADFYQRALAASGQQGTQFDKGQVTRRLSELKP